MKSPSNGITPEVIRDFMPPYHLRADLLEATILALPRPPPDALATWREERLVRLVEEITALRPADAAQARIASQILVVRELGDTLANQAHAADVPMEMCRLSRGAGAMVQTAMGLERLLVRHQKMPVTFYGTVVRDEVDIAALDAVWCRKPVKQSAPAELAAGGEPVGRRRIGVRMRRASQSRELLLPLLLRVGIWGSGSTVGGRDATRAGTPPPAPLPQGEGE